MTRLRSHVMLSGLLLALEGWLGIRVFGAGVGIVGAFVALGGAFQKERQRRQLVVAAIYVLLFIGTEGIILSNWRVAQHRAAPVISAIELFHSKQGRYPGSLNELVPSYLPAIPRGGFTWISRRFGYIATRPQPYFAAMFHGVVAYDFPTRSWITND